MTLLLVVLQQNRIVGPFSKPPAEGNELERFSKDYQPEDMQALINEELLKQPAPPLVQFAMAGGDKLTEFAVSQEIPKFGVHFYYVCSMEPLYDFQRRNQAKIPRGLMGPTRSTIKDLNAGIEELLRTEKQKLKVTVDKTGRKQIKIRDENVLGGGGRTRAMPKHLRARLGAAAAAAPPAPSQEPEVEIPLTTFVEQPSPPRRPARPVAARPIPTRSRLAPQQQVDLQNPSIAVAVKAGAAVARLETAATADAVAGPSTRPTGAIPKVKAPAAKSRPGQLRVPTTAPGQPAQVQPARGLRQPGRAAPQVRPPAGRAAQRPPVQQTPQQQVPEARYTTPYRFTPHPWASPTPPIFKYGARHEGPEYEQQQFGVPAAEKFAVPMRKIKALKWTPSRRGERPQMRDIVRKHPIPEEVRQITEVAERPYISTPEVEQEVYEQMRREHLVEQADERTSRLMARFYAGKSLVPRALDFSTADTSMRPGEQAAAEEEIASGFEPYLLDDTPVTEDELMAEEEMEFGDDLFAGGWGRSPAEVAQPVAESEAVEEAQGLSVSPPRIAVASPPRQSPATSATSPRQSPATVVTPPRQPQYFVEEEQGFLEDEDIYLVDDQDYALEASPLPPTPLSPITPVRMPTPVTPTTRIADARRLFLTTMIEDAPAASPPRPSPGGTTARLLDVPIRSPLPTRSPGVPEFDIMTSPKTPEKMDTKVAVLLNAIEAQVEAHKHLIGEVSEMPRTPSLDNLVTELSHGNDALQRLRLNFEAYKTARAEKPATPPQPVESAMPAQLTLDLQNLSDLVEETKDGAEMLQEIAETAEDPVVQQAAQQSLETSKALAEISNQMQHLTTLWEQSMAQEGSSLGLLDEQDITGGGDLFGEEAAPSPLQATVNEMVESLDQSIKDVISGDASPQDLQAQLRDFQQALKDIDLEGSLLEGSQPIDELLQSANELETSIQKEAAAVDAVTNTPERASLLQRSEHVIDGMNEILDFVAPQPPTASAVSTVPTPQRMAIASRLETLRQAQQQTAARPDEGTLVLTAVDEAAQRHVVDHPRPFAINWEDEQDAGILDEEEMEMDDLMYEDPRAYQYPPAEEEILDASFMQTDDMFGDEFITEPARWTPTASPVAGPSGVQQQMMNLLVETQHQQEALLNASLAVQESSYDVAAVAASQQVARKLAQNQAAVAQMINQIQAGEENFGWLGPMEQMGKGRVPAARGPAARGPARGVPAAGARQVQQRAPARPATTQARPVTRPATAGQQMPRKTTVGLQRPTTASRATVGQPKAAAAARQAAGAVPRPVRRPGSAPSTTTAAAEAAAAPAKPPPIRRPPGGVAQAPAVRQQQPQQVAPPAGTGPKPRAGSAVPIPVKRPPQPIPLPAGSASTTQLRPSPSVRAMLPRPGPAGGPVSKRR
ncbi:hypothetical protein quinque_013772 [Culex quinquefasciatus]